MSDRRERRRRRLLRERELARQNAEKPIVSAPTRPSPKKSGQTRAERLKIPEHGLVALECQGRRFFRRWRLARADAISRRILYLDPHRPRAWWLLGDIEMRRMQWKQAVENFERALQYIPTNSILWCRGAEALFYLGEHERSDQWFAEVYRLDSSEQSGAARRARRFLAHHKSASERVRRGGKASVVEKRQTAQVGRAVENPAGACETQALSEKELQAALAKHLRATSSEKRSSEKRRGSRSSPKSER